MTPDQLPAGLLVKALYLACRGKGPGVWVGDICDALDSIDNGAYNPKIGGEE